MTKTDQEFTARNTDRELWREPHPEGEAYSFYAPSIHVTERGGIGINVGGTVIVKTLRDWHELALRSPAPLQAQTSDARIDEATEANTIGGTDTAPVVHRDGLIGDLAAMFAASPSPTSAQVTEERWRTDVENANKISCIVTAKLYHSDTPAVGEAHWVASSDADGAWWWANQDEGDYHAEPIQGEIVAWMPLPAPFARAALHPGREERE